MVLRQRKKGFNAVVVNLDAFPKVPENYLEKTASGASISIVTVILVFVLLWNEYQYFYYPGFKFRFMPDTDFEAKLTINIDMTIATRCAHMQADIVDSTNQNPLKFGVLQEEETWFELDSSQRQHFDSIQVYNKYLREEYHAIQDLLWTSGFSFLFGSLPKRRIQPKRPFDACRVYGSLTLNKVAGNLHASPGKSIPLLGGHTHLSAFNSPGDFNFSHRIDRFSFGASYGGIISPLEGEEKMTDKNLVNYQYFIQVVPTDIQGYSDALWSTYQYSVKDYYKSLEDSYSGSSVPGIYFKYDVSALKVLAFQDREPLWQFLVRLVSAVGGLVSTSQIISALIKLCMSKLCGISYEK